MLKKLLCGAAVAALTGHAAIASQVIVNGTSYAAGTTHNVSYGQPVAHNGAAHNCCQPGAATYTSAPMSYEAAPVSYETAPMSYEAAPMSYEAAPVSYETMPVTYETAPVTYGTPEVVTTTYAPATAPMVQPAYTAPTVSAPVMKHSGKKGWGSQVYVGARGGLSFAKDTDFAFGGTTVDNEYENEGYNVAAVVGWRNRVSQNLGYRVEAELGYQRSEIDTHEVGGAPFPDTSFGDTKTLYGFANLFLDVPVVGGLNGIVGGGIGAGRVEFDGHGVDGAGVVMDDKDTVFGYHLDAGVSYDINDRLALEAMYRYTSFVDVELEAVDGSTSKTDVDSHNVLIGARYGF